jgi:hypothetical protein
MAPTVTPAALRFPYSRVLLPRTRLAYIHLRNLLNDAKRDRTARVSGYVAVSLLDELVLFYLLDGEAANATVRDPQGSRVISIAGALERVPADPEYGEICFHQAGEEQLACMFATHVEQPEPWPDDLTPGDPRSLFPYIASTTFDGFVEIVANENVNYLVFRNGAVARTFLTDAPHGTIVDRVSKLFAREGRIGDLLVRRWGVAKPLPVQAPTALVQAYRELVTSIVARLVEIGRNDAPTIAEQARASLCSAHPVLDGFSVIGKPAKDSTADAATLTAGVAAWLRELLWSASDQDNNPPETIFRELTWERRHMFQSAGLFDQVPWKAW